MPLRPLRVCSTLCTTGDLKGQDINFPLDPITYSFAAEPRRS